MKDVVTFENFNVEVSNYEDCPVFVRRYQLSRYFKRIFSHAYSFYDKDTFYINPEREVLKKFESKEVEKVVVIDVSFDSKFLRDHSNTIFYNPPVYLSLPIEFKIRTSDKLELPLIKYDPYKNVGIAADISHSLSNWGDYIKDLDKIMSEFKKFLKPIKNVYVQVKSEITIGMDFEAEAIKSHNVLNMNNVVSEDDLIGGLNIFEAESGAVGIDGSWNQLEIRPKPERDPLRLLEKSYDLINKIPKKLNLFINFNSLRYPCGCHIHFALPPSHRRRDLDKYLTPLYKIAAILNHKKLSQQEKRLEWGYGRGNDYRIKPWGVEYRAFPAVILADPDLAERFLTAIYDIVLQYWRTGKVKVNMRFFEELFQEMKEKFEKPYFYSYKPQIEVGPENSEFARWLEEKLEKSISAPYPYVSFYSLKAERGMVTAGFSTYMTETIDHPNKKISEKIFRFGIPHVWMKKGIPREVWKNILEAIVAKANAYSSKEVEVACV